MGRTYRNRKRQFKKEIHSRNSVENCPEIISLNKWIKNNGFKKFKKMTLINFPDTGRGVMANENIETGEVLMEIPFHLILSMHTLETDNFKNIFVNVNEDSQETKIASCQDLISFYVAFLKMSQSLSFWSYYIQTIPDNFTVPYFCTDLPQGFDDGISNILQIQKSKINDAYHYFKSILTSSFNSVSAIFVPKFTLELYSWAYFAVNTRCVYLNPVIINNIVNIQSGALKNSRLFLDFICDTPNLGLIPFLDMFNHSPDAKTDARLVYPLNNDKNYTPLNNVICNKSSLREGFPIFRLITLTACSKHHQVFISYGHHSNLKLLTEYGFCLPVNPFSTVNFTFENICSIIKEENFPFILNTEKFKYIVKHRINMDIFINLDGLSYNFSRLLYIISDDNKNMWDKNIFCSDFCDNDKLQIFHTAKPILHRLRNLYLDVLSTFSAENNTDIFLQCLNLIRDYVNIIDKVLELNKYVNT